jgi:hypothetical protein
VINRVNQNHGQRLFFDNILEMLYHGRQGAGSIEVREVEIGRQRQKVLLTVPLPVLVAEWRAACFDTWAE